MKPLCLVIFLQLLTGIFGICSGNNYFKPISANKEYTFNQSDYLILFDPDSQYSIQEISRLPDSAFNFRSETFNPDNHRSFWLKLKLRVKDSLDAKWIYELFNKQAGEIILFAQNGNKEFVAIDTVGSEIPFYQRNLYSRCPAFEVPLKAGENVLYIKYSSKHWLALNTVIQPYRNYINFANQYYFVIGGFYFVLLILLLYNLLFYLSTRDKIYIYYILFVIASALDCLKSDHIGFAIFWPEHPEINSFIDDYLRAFFVFGVVNYASYFLSVKKDFPRLHNYLWMFFSLFFMQQAVVPSVFPLLPYYLWLSEAFIFAMLLMLLYVAIIRLKQGHKPVRIFIIGYISMLTGFVVTYFFYNGWIEGNYLVYYILFYGIAIDTFMFSFALSSRLRHERLEKERALRSESDARQKVIEHMQQNEILLNRVNAELEEKVRERTLELEDSNQKLAGQAEIIRQWNIKLDKENWDLNKTIKSLKIRKVIPENQTYIQMAELFPTETECYIFLSEYKWESGFHCRKCGNCKESKTNNFYSRRCSKCGTIESITANTIFHKLKFPLDKAFYIAYSVFMWKENLNVSDLSREIDLNYKTTLKFKMKIEEAIEARRKEGVKIKSWEDLIFEH